jgi:sigma-B regulation protein RsbU (phosphoserine phosphatase)
MSELLPTEDYQDLFEHAPCGYLTIGPDGRIRKANATLTSWTGFASDRFIGKRLHQFLNMAGRIYCETHIAPLLRMQGFFNEFALDFETAAGKHLPVIANAVERRDACGGPLFTAVVVIRATDRRRYERELVESRSKLQQGLATQQETAELREQFIAVLGHDLRNPLAAIGAGAQILRRSGSLQGQQKELSVLTMMDATVTRLSDLIDDILDFARGRLGGGIMLHRDAQPLQPVLEQVVEELRTASPNRLIETSFEIHQSVDCDRKRIGQLASNLIGNALTHGAPDQPVRVGARTEAGEFSLWVANAGDPISEAAMQRLFEPFFRGDVRASRQGLGLGLHIASQIAQAHGGRIDVSSTPEETRFTFRMPAQAAPHDSGYRPG